MNIKQTRTNSNKNMKLLINYMVNYEVKSTVKWGEK